MENKEIFTDDEKVERYIDLSDDERKRLEIKHGHYFHDIGMTRKDIIDIYNEEFPWIVKQTNWHLALGKISVVQRLEDTWEVFYPGFDIESQRIWGGSREDCIKFAEEFYTEQNSNKENNS